MKSIKLIKISLIYGAFIAIFGIVAIMLPLSLLSCDWYPTPEEWKSQFKEAELTDTTSLNMGQKVSHHAHYQTKQNTVYDGSWVNIGYPGGDPGYQQGVCTDVVIRAYRFVDIDFQQLIHEDMKKAHDVYNKRYLTKKLDNNIDHRRTQNIQTYLTRMGARIPIPDRVFKYQPGDIVFWDIAAGHTGIVSDIRSTDHGGFLVIHNIGGGAQYEDLLLNWEPIEVYRITDKIASKMQKNCSFKYNEEKDFKRYVQ